MTSKNQQREAMVGRHFVFLWILVSATKAFPQAGVQQDITGTISHGGIRLPKAMIRNGEQQSQSGSEGEYRMKATPGDLLLYTFPGMRTVAVVVENVMNILNNYMPVKIEQLDDVYVSRARGSIVCV